MQYLRNFSLCLIYAQHSQHRSLFNTIRLQRKTMALHLSQCQATFTSMAMTLSCCLFKNRDQPRSLSATHLWLGLN